MGAVCKRKNGACFSSKGKFRNTKNFLYTSKKRETILSWAMLFNKKNIILLYNKKEEKEICC